MRRRILGLAVLAALAGCGGSGTPSIGGMDVPPGSDPGPGIDTALPPDAGARDAFADLAGDLPKVDVWLPDPGTDTTPPDVAPDVSELVLPNPLCQPCRTDLDCQTSDVTAPCLEEGPNGRVCGYPCAVDADCPADFECVRDDVHGRQCRPLDGGACPCLPRFVSAGFTTTCYRENELGRCEGQRTCDQPCPVSAPTPEVCDGKDNDCNGQTDEGLGTTTCGLGACEVTVQSCIGGQPKECVPRAATTEVCDGVDNDCDGQTDEDLGVLTCGLGICATSVDACIGGRPQPCWPLPAGVEACNGLDDDCDGDTDEGFGETTCGTGACQRTVANCQDGQAQACVPGQPAPEVCNGVDDNCDGQTDEGLGTITCGVGECARQVPGCKNGVPSGATCVPGDPAPEVCNGRDDNCDGQTDEGFNVGQACDGPDADLCATGTIRCRPDGTAECFEPGNGFTETCNGRDDNCDGRIDESGCPCPVATFNGHAYQFCSGTTRNWTDARDACAGNAPYHLVKIEDAAENQFVVDKAYSISTSQWWIGLNDRDKEGTYVWLDGTGAPYLPWLSGQPNNGGTLGNQDCVEILTSGKAYTWNDAECYNRYRYVCEAP